MEIITKNEQVYKLTASPLLRPNYHKKPAKHHAGLDRYVGQQMKNLFFIKIMFFITVIFTGCMPLKQHEIVACSHSKFYVRYKGGYITVYFDGALANKDYKIIDDETYLTGPNKKKYSTYHKETDNGTQLFIKDSKGKTIRFWSNGIWELSLSARDKNGQVDLFKLDLKLWTFYYSPIIHGAPN